MAEDKSRVVCPTEEHFTISVEQLLKIEAWLEKHDKKCMFGDSRRCGAIGGRLRYIFIPTSLGVISKVMCACKVEIDVTDYASW